MTSAVPGVRVLAERASSRTQVRLLWRQGTRQLWVEVREADDRVLAISVRPERALGMRSITRMPTRVRTVSFAESSRSRLVRTGLQAAGKDRLEP